MCRRNTVVAVALLAIATAGAPATASPEPTIRQQSVTKFGKSAVHEYDGLHKWATKSFGKRTVGRHVVKYGMPRKGEDRVATKAEFAETLGVLRRWKNPPPVPHVASVSHRSDTHVTPPQETRTSVQSSSGASSGGGGAGGSTVQCESGGNYQANTGNGYYGGWQFDHGTWDAYGDPKYGEANEAPPAVQDQAAARVPYDAWPNC